MREKNVSRTRYAAVAASREMEIGFDFEGISREIIKSDSTFFRDVQRSLVRDSFRCVLLNH